MKIYNGNTYMDELICPNCGVTCEDNQDDTWEEFKEEYCGNCDTQFGYQEILDEIGGEWIGEDFINAQIKLYYTYRL